MLPTSEHLASITPGNYKRTACKVQKCYSGLRLNYKIINLTFRKLYSAFVFR